MNIVEILLIALGLAMDAFAVSVCKDLSLEKSELPSTPRQERGEGEGKKNHNGVGVRQKAGERYPLSGFSKNKVVAS